MDFLEEVESGDRRRALVALRDLLAFELEPTDHVRSCECECGPPAGDARTMAALSKELRGVLLEIEKLPDGKVVTDLDRIASRVDAGRDDLAERRTHRGATGARPLRT